MKNLWRPAKRRVSLLPVLILLLGVACGAAATATIQPTAAPIAAPTPASTGAGGSAPAPQAAPTATLVPPPGGMVHPGKLNLVVGNLGNERFDYVFVGGTGGSFNYSHIVGAWLIASSKTRGMEPGVASKWGLSPDGLTWTFTIRKGVKFHDGSEVTAQDALWSLQHYFGPQVLEYGVGTSPQRLSRNMVKIEVSGPDEVSLVTKKPDTSLANQISQAGTGFFYVLPKRDKIHDVEVEAAYDRNPIGAGPGKLVKHVQADLMAFERFDDYYYQPKNGLPEDRRFRFQSLNLRLVPEEATRVAAIRAGEADIVPVSIATKKQVEAGGGRVLFGQEGSSVEVFFMGCWDPQYPCHDKRVRQALGYAMNKEVMRDNLYGGPESFQAKGWNWVTPSTVGYTTALDPWPFDPVKARQLLADAGYPGGKGFSKLIVNTYPPSAVPFQVEAAQLGADTWRRELGIEVEVLVGDGVANRKRQEAGELNGQINWRDNSTRTDATTGVLVAYGDPKSGQRVHENPEVYRLVEEAFGILDPDKRAEASKTLFLRLREESYNLGVGYVNIPWAVGPRVVTWKPDTLSPWPSALHTITLK